MKGGSINLIKYIEIYLVSTILLYVFGPIAWRTENTFIFTLLVAAYLIALYLGYQKGCKKTIIRNSNFFTVDTFVNKYYLFSFIYLTMNVLRAVRVTRLYGFQSVEDLIFSAFTSSSSVYDADALQTAGSQMFGGTPLSLAHMLLGPITVAFIPLTISCFSKLKSKRWLVIINIAVFVASQVINGTNEGFAHIVIYILAGFLLSQNTNLDREQAKKRNRKITIIFIIAVIGMIAAFNYVMSDRNGEFYDFSQMGANAVDENNWFFKIIPENMRALLVWITFYACGGYYGMSLALNVDWTPMFGAGFSSYLRGNLEAFTHLPLTEDTLMWTNNQGWPYGVVWHTAYTWFASDVHWLGVILIMYGIGYLFAVTFRSASERHDPITVGLFSLILMMVIFLPANNKVFSLSDTFFAFFFYLIVWASSKKHSV